MSLRALTEESDHYERDWMRKDEINDDQRVTDFWTRRARVKVHAVQFLVSVTKSDVWSG
ncbi:hypothetical protein BaRGS_00007392, partial [Batillaria attramentaria]